MRLLRPVPLSVLTMLYASVVAVYGWSRTSLGLSFFCSGHPLRGANILHGIALAFFAGLVGPALIWVLIAIVEVPFLRPRRWRPSVVAVCLIETAALGSAIGFVALDSATYVQQNSACGMFSPATGAVSGHVGELYYLWGIAVAALLVHTVRVLRQGPPEPPRDKYEHRPPPPLPQQGQRATRDSS
jgi:hypothetical protein